MSHVALCIALLVTLLVPLAHADMRAASAIVDELRGECSGETAFVPLQTRLHYDDRASIATKSFLAGTALRLERAEGTDAHIAEGPLGSGNLYSNYRSDVVETFEYDAFELDLVDFLDASTVTILPGSGGATGWAGAKLPNGFDLVAPVGEVVAYGDPRDPFHSEPRALRFSAALIELSIAGDVRLLIEQTEFKVRANDQADLFRAEHSTVAGDDTAVQVQYFLLHVQDARLVTTAAPVSADVFADIMQIDCVGTILDAGATDFTPIAEGDLGVSPRRAQDRISVDYTVSEPSEPAAETAQVGIARSAFPYWGFLVAFGLVATGAGITAWRSTRKPTPVPEIPAAPARAIQSPAPPGPRTLPELEQAYRLDAGNTVLALELGLAYAKKGLPHDALPLLQLGIREYPKMDTLRYFTGIALLEVGRIDEALRHLSYSFRLNALNVARFINEGAAIQHGHHARVRAMLAGWSRQFQESNARGYV